MEYNRERCCRYIICRLSEIINQDAINCNVKSQETYIQQAKGLHIGFFKYGGRKLLAEIDMDNEFEHMREMIEQALDGLLTPARKKSLQKNIIITSMRSLVEIPLKESGLEFLTKYNNKSADVKIRIGKSRWLEVNMKYDNISESVDKLIAAAQAMQELVLTAGNNIGLPTL